MKHIQRWLTRLVFRLVPQLEKLVKSAGGTIDRLAEEVSILRADRDDRRDQGRMLIEEMREAAAMAGAGPWQAVPSTVGARESASNSGPAQVALRERMWDLELALEDQGWQRQLAQSQMEFSRWGIQQIILLSRLYRIKNPLIQRGILVSSYYVFGRGFEVSSPDEKTNEVLDEFFSDPRNICEIGQKAITEKESTLYTDGNIFWTLFTSPTDGRVVVRTIDAVEISEIITDPDDASVPFFYLRQWVQESFDTTSGQRKYETVEGWYVAIDYEPPTKLSQIGGKPIMLDASGDYVRVLHQKDGGLPKWRFGCPRVYAALDWARAYKQRLEDYASITRALARFAWDVKTKGGSPAIAALKGTFATTLVNDGSMIEQNPPPVTGSSFISGQNTTVSPVRTAGATPSPEEGRRLAHMVYMVFGLGEHFFADISAGNMATATTLDRPTELKFLHDQENWKVVLQRIGRFVVERSASAPNGRLREAAAAAQSIQIDVSFPAIREGDIPQLVNATVAAMNLGASDGKVNGIDERAGVGILLQLLGYENREELLELMYPTEEYDPNRETQKEEAAKREQAMTKTTAQTLPVGSKEALKRLQSAVNALVD